LWTLAAAREQELETLRRQAANLQQSLGELNSRIQELDKPAPDTSEKEHE
jgi:prefoldin subunit 5